MIHIGFSRSVNKFAIFSKLIMVVEKRPFSHVFILLPESTTQKLMVFQASKNTVNLVSYDNFVKHNEIVHTFSLFCNEKQLVNLWHFAFERLGNQYSWVQVFLIGLSRLFNTSYAYSNGEEETICSELVARVLVNMGVSVPYNLDTISPRELHALLESYNAQLVS